MIAIANTTAIIPYIYFNISLVLCQQKNPDFFKKSGSILIFFVFFGFNIEFMRATRTFY